jgi:hypothetical protein
MTGQLKKGRGGRRPGAGPPKGSANALKTGEHSRKIQELIKALEPGQTLVFYTKKGGIRYYQKPWEEE